MLAIISIALQFVYHWYTITQLGSGWQTDALYAGLVVPVFVLSVVSTSLTHVLVPILTSCASADFEDSVWFYLYIVGFLFLAITLLLIVTDSIWIPLILPGFTAESINLTTSVFEIQVYGVLGASVVAVLEAASHARLKFYNIEVARIAVALIGLVALSLTIDGYGVYAAAVIYSLRPVLLAALLMVHAGRFRRFRFDFLKLIIVWAKLKFLIAGGLYYRLGPLLDRYLLSAAIPGSITLYYLSQQIYSAANTVLSKAISSPMVPLLAKEAKEQNWLEFRSTYLGRLALVALTSLAGILVLAVFGKPLLVFFFQHENFSEVSVSLMWGILLALSGMFFAGSLGQVLSSSFYAYGNTRLPTMIGVIGYSIGIFLKVWGFTYYGIVGLAFATSCYYFLNALALYVALRNRVETKVDCQSSGGGHGR